jgi:hypothetical protein
VQNAAKRVRRQQAKISDIQATLNQYAAKVLSPSSKASSAAAAAAAGSSAAAGAASTTVAAAGGGGSGAGAGDVYDDLRPGDFVWVPSFVEADQLMKVQLLKVRNAGCATNAQCWCDTFDILPYSWSAVLRAQFQEG